MCVCVVVLASAGAHQRQIMRSITGCLHYAGLLARERQLLWHENKQRKNALTQANESAPTTKERSRQRISPNRNCIVPENVNCNLNCKWTHIWEMTTPRNKRNGRKGLTQGVGNLEYQSGCKSYLGTMPSDLYLALHQRWRQRIIGCIALITGCLVISGESNPTDESALFQRPDNGGK